MDGWQGAPRDKPDSFITGVWKQTGFDKRGRQEGLVTTQPHRPERGQEFELRSQTAYWCAAGPA